MADGLIQLPADSTGKKIDTSELTVGANTVERERLVIADPNSVTGLATVSNYSPSTTTPGLVVRPIPGGDSVVTASVLDVSGINNHYDINPNGHSYCSIQLVGLGTTGATLLFTASVDGSNFIPTGFFSVNSWAAFSGQGIVNDDIYIIPVSGFTKFRVIISIAGTGTITVNSVLTDGASDFQTTPVFASGTAPVSVQVINAINLLANAGINIGSVALLAGIASIGNVGLNAGNNNIGSVAAITGGVALNNATNKDYVATVLVKDDDEYREGTRDITMPPRIGTRHRINDDLAYMAGTRG